MSKANRSPLPRGIDISAYRIVQEGLTNALKHAKPPAPTSPALRAEQLDDRSARRRQRRRSGAANGVGYGLVGIRERVKLYGGEMSAGRAHDGGFVLTTRLPVTGYTR